MSDKIVDFSAYKDLKDTAQENVVFKELYYDLARAVENAINSGTKRESDRCLVMAQRLAEYKYLAAVEDDIESLDIFMAGFNVDEYLDRLYKEKNNNNK